jgi:hypothetical protein
LEHRDPTGSGKPEPPSARRNEWRPRTPDVAELPPTFFLVNSNLTSTTTRVGNEPTPGQIAERARILWEHEGRPEGRDLAHWLDAERQLRGGSGSSGAAKKTAAGKRAKSSTDESSRADIESDKRVDGLIEQPPSPARRTPSGERL